MYCKSGEVTERKKGCKPGGWDGGVVRGDGLKEINAPGGDTRIDRNDRIGGIRGAFDRLL